MWESSQPSNYTNFTEIHGIAAWKSRIYSKIISWEGNLNLITGHGNFSSMLWEEEAQILHSQENTTPPKKGNKDSIPKGKELDQTPGIHRDCSQHPTNGTWNDSQVFLQIQGIKDKSAVGILAFKYNSFLGEKKTPNKQTPQHVQGFTKGILFPIFHSLKTGSTFRCSLNPFFFYAIKSLLFTFSRDFSLSLVRNRSQKLLPKLPFGVFFFVDKNFHGRG